MEKTKPYLVLLYDSDLARLIQLVEQENDRKDDELLACLQEQKEMAEAPGNQ